MEYLSRRDFLQKSFGTLLAASLVSSLCRAQALTGGVKSLADRWVFEMEEISKSLRASKIRQSEWQTQIEELLSRVEMKDLLKAIDYRQLAKHAVLPEDHESAEDIDFSGIKGLPGELSFAPYFYAMKKDVAIVPHGHRNMLTMHMVLSGEAHGWHYDRVTDEPEHLIIKPTSDKMLKPGDASTVSDDRDNIHWFKALTEPVFMFNIGVYGVKKDEKFTGRDYIDPAHGEKIDDGLIRARRIEKDEAYKLYGKT